MAAKKRSTRKKRDPETASRTSRRGGRPRTRASNIPKLPVLESGLTPDPQPMEDPPLTLENVERYKRSDCKYYEKCLDFAAKSGWNQFHCRACKTYEPDPEADEAYRALVARMSKRSDPIF